MNKYIVEELSTGRRHRIDAAVYEVRDGAHIFKTNAWDYPIAVFPVRSFFVKKEG